MIRAKGTRVIVFGNFDCNRKKPWKNLLSDGKSNDIYREYLLIRFLDEILEDKTDKKHSDK